MGQINVKGLGVVNIEGNEPNANEIEKIKSALNDKNQMLHQGIQAPDADQIENSFNFQRFLLEAGLSIGGAVATGGATVLPTLARTAGMLSKPFLKRLALTAGGSAVGGGAGAGLAQTFDPREDILQEIARGAMEGATAELIGAPIAIKGATYLNKYLSAPAKRPELLKGAAEAEAAIVRKSQDILLDAAVKKGDRKAFQALVDDYAKAGRKDIDSFDTLQEGLKGLTKVDDKIVDFAREAQQGLTPGIKTSTRALEIIENIAQKSLIGGGGITRRYEATKEIGNLLAADYMANIARVAGKDTMGDMFFSALGGARDQYRAAVTGAFSAVDDAMAAAGLKNFGIVPFGKLTTGLKRGEKLAPMLKPSTEAVQSVDDFIAETAGLGQFAKTNSFLQKDVLGVFRGFADQQGGSLTLKQATLLRQTLNKKIGELAKMKGTGKEVGVLTSIRNRIDDELDIVSKMDDKVFESIYKTKPPKDALMKLKNAIAFNKQGADVFNEYQLSRILSQGLTTTAGTTDSIFQTIVKGGDKTKSTEIILKQLDDLPKLKDPNTGRAIMTTQQATQLKNSFKGHFIRNIYNSSLNDAGSQYGGQFIDSAKFSRLLDQNEAQLKLLFKGKELKELQELDNVLKFANGQLSRLGGLPGGVFIQLKQAGAATNLLQLGGAGFSGAAFGFLSAPTAAILLGPAAMSYALLKPGINKYLFGKAALRKLSDKDPNKVMQASIVSFRQTVGGLLNDNIITKEEADKALADAKIVEEFYKVNKIPSVPGPNDQSVVEGDPLAVDTLAPEPTSLNLPALSTPLPNVQPSNVGALFPQDGLSQAIAANRAPAQLKVGGIVSAKKN